MRSFIIATKVQFPCQFFCFFYRLAWASAIAFGLLPCPISGKQTRHLPREATLFTLPAPQPACFLTTDGQVCG
jgi:hypothetical protein